MQVEKYMKYQKTIKSQKPALLVGASKFDINILNTISKKHVYC